MTVPLRAASAAARVAGDGLGVARDLGDGSGDGGGDVGGFSNGRGLLLSALGYTVNGAAHLLHRASGPVDRFGLLRGALGDLLDGGCNLAGGLAGLVGGGRELARGGSQAVGVFGDCHNRLAQVGDHGGESIAQFILFGFGVDLSG